MLTESKKSNLAGVDVNANEAGHYVVTSHRPGGVMLSVKCSFLAPNSTDVVIAKSRRLEVRQLQLLQPNSNSDSNSNSNNNLDDTMTMMEQQDSSFNIVLSVPINGRITTLLPFKHPSSNTDYIFFTTETKKYAIISYDPPTTTTTATGTAAATATSNHAYNIITHASGDLSEYGLTIRGNEPENGPIATLEPNHTCIALHLYEGYVTILPIHKSYRYNKTSGASSASTSTSISVSAASTALLSEHSKKSHTYNSSWEFTGPAFHCRIEERDVFSMTFLSLASDVVNVNAIVNANVNAQGKSRSRSKTMPQLAILHQDSRGYQHVIAHSLDLIQKQLIAYHVSMPTSTSGVAGSGNGKSNTGVSIGGGNAKKGSLASFTSSASSSLVSYHAPPPQERLKKSRVEGSSGIIIPIPITSSTLSSSNNNRMSVAKDVPLEAQKMSWNQQQSQNHQNQTDVGGVLILGQQSITYHNTAQNITKILPMSQCIILSYAQVEVPASTSSASSSSSSSSSKIDSTLRYILADDSGKLYILALLRDAKNGKVTDLHLDALGSTNVSSTLVYLERGLLFLGSQFADSQLIQVLEEPVDMNSSMSMSTMGGMTSASMSMTSTLNAGGIGRHLTYLNVVEEYVNLGPIVDFDLVPTTHQHHSLDHTNSTGGAGNGNGNSNTSKSSSSSQKRQSMAITASGAGKDGTIRIVSNGIGMSEQAAVELGGIKGMWNIRKSFHDSDDAYLIQSYVGETRILGVVVNNDEDDQHGDKDNVLDTTDESSEVGATLEEVEIEGIDAERSTLFAGNICCASANVASATNDTYSSLMVQITEREVRIIDLVNASMACSWVPSGNELITVASANESGQIVVVLNGRNLIYLQITVTINGNVEINFISQLQLDKEISCLTLNPFDNVDDSSSSDSNAMEIDNESDMDVDSKEHGSFGSGSRSQPLKSKIVAVGLWDNVFVHLLSLDPKNPLLQLDKVNIAPDEEGSSNNDEKGSNNESSQHFMARSLCFVTLQSTTNNGASRGYPTPTATQTSNGNRVNMLLVGLGDGGLVSFVVNVDSGRDSKCSVHSRKEVNLGTRAINLVPFYNHTAEKGTCVLASGDRPTVIYLGGGSGSSNKIPKLCYSNINLESDPSESDDGITMSSRRCESLVVNVATPFHSSDLFAVPSGADKHYSLCISDESMLRLGLIDDIQKLHITTHKLGMAPRRVTYHESGRVVCVGCIDESSGKFVNNSKSSGTTMGNCIRFFDDTSFEEIDRIDLDPFEMILSMVSTNLKVYNDESLQMEEDDKDSNQRQQDSEGNEGSYRSFVVVGTAYCYPDEDEPSRGRILLIQCSLRGEISVLSRKATQVTEVQVRGGVYSICPFYNGTILATINSKMRLCKLICGGPGMNGSFDLKIDGAGHHGHILSLSVKSLANRDGHTESKKQEQIAIVGDLVRSISVVKYYPEYGTLEEVSRDFNQNWTSAIEMLNENTYLGGENFYNLFVLRRNPTATSEEVRCRLDTIGLFNLGEMVNKFMSGSLVIPNSQTSNSSTVSASTNNTANASSEGNVISLGRKPTVKIGSQTLYATIDGSIGSILGLDVYSAAFLSALERAMSRVITPVGNLKHEEFRAFRRQRRQQASKGFVDGDFIESFIDLDRKTMDLIVQEMNKDGDWDVDSPNESIDDGADVEMKGRTDCTKRTLIVCDVIAMVEEISMLH